MRPIGVFDSGVGGLTVVTALRRLLPRRPILYLGDTARLPYGTKSGATVVRYTRRNLEFLLAREVDGVVVACNTASAHALGSLEAPVPVWGVVEPGARQATLRSGGRVGVIATESTIRSGAYTAAIHRHRPELEVISRACPLFVPLVEEGWQDDEVAETVARRYLAPLMEAGVDTLVLGCTHYPLLKPLLERVLGPEVTLVDSAEAVSEEVAAALGEEEAGEAGAPPEDHFCVTDTAEHFQRLAAAILARERVSLELVELAPGG